mgnify:CR=1 FL=1
MSISDPTIQEQIRLFQQQLDASARFYQQAVSELAIRQMIQQSEPRLTPTNGRRALWVACRALGRNVQQFLSSAKLPIKSANTATKAKKKRRRLFSRAPARWRWRRSAARWGWPGCRSTSTWASSASAVSTGHTVGRCWPGYCGPIGPTGRPSATCATPCPTCGGR